MPHRSQRSVPRPGTRIMLQGMIVSNSNQLVEWVIKDVVGVLLDFLGLAWEDRELSEPRGVLGRQSLLAIIGHHGGDKLMVA